MPNHQMAYLRTWRRDRAEVLALAGSSGSSDDYQQPACIHRDVLHSDGVPSQPQSEQASPSTSSGQNGGDQSSESEFSSEGQNLSLELSKWANRNRLRRSCLTELLWILRKEGHQLPKDARTLLKTPRSVDVIEKCGGDYHYFGLETSIINTLMKHEEFLENNNSVDLKVNIDGVPLYKSTNDQFWPILVAFDKFQPSVVALFCGKAKPQPVGDFLADFLEEYTHLSQHGLTYNGTSLCINIKCFICDAPARSFLKCTKGHSGYHSCERCTIKGSYEGRVVYDPTQRFPKRTNEQFLNRAYTDHQIGVTPLIEMGFPCVTAFALDYMHLVCLGVVRRLLAYLKQGPRICKLSAQLWGRISDNLVSLRGQLPSEFARQPRSLEHLDRWKATEFRQFLLYTGPLVLKGIVTPDVYNNFLTLAVSLSFLLDSHDEKRNHYLPYAQQLLQYFVTKCSDIYGMTFNVYNVHNLIHLCDDVDTFSCSLNEVSAFPFENYLQMIKKLVRSSCNPIAQVTKRMSEAEKAGTSPVLTSHFRYISSRRKDSCFILRTEQFIIIREKREDGYCVCDVLRSHHLESFFKEPCDSKLLNIVYISGNNMDNGRKKLLHRSDLYRKVVCLTCGDGYVLLPMLHGLERE